MCFSPPKITTAETVTPAALPPPIDEDEVTGSVSYGNTSKEDEKTLGKKSLKVKRKAKTTTSLSPSTTGANTNYSVKTKSNS